MYGWSPCNGSAKQRSGSLCRYATAGTDAVILLLSSALVPRLLYFAFDYLLPAFWRLVTKPYTMEHYNSLQLNGEFNLGRSMAEVSLLTMHTLTYGAGVPAGFFVLWRLDRWMILR